MAIYKIIREKELILGIWKMEETISELLSFFKQVDPYKDAIHTFSSDKRKKEWLTSRVLLQCLSGEEKEIIYSSSGKPFLKDRSYHISISHTKGYVSVALHPYQEVGIDVEQINDKILRLKGKILQPREEEQLSPENQLSHLLLHFSGKESVYKLMDIEGLELKSHLYVLPFIFSSQGEFYIKENKTGEEKVFPVKYHIDQDFVLTYTIFPT